VFGNVRLALDSTKVDFGSVSLTGSKNLVLEIWDTSSSDIQIDRLSVGGLNSGEFTVSAPFSTPFVVPAGAAHTKLTITFHPQGIGLRSAVLLIQTTDGTIAVPLSGIGGGHSALALSNSSIDFGKLAPGVYRDSVIMMYSTGADTATVTALEIVESDTSFSAQTISGEQTPFMLAPGDSVAIRVSFIATDLLGQKDGQLVVLGTQSSPTCTLTAIDSMGSFTIDPNVIDFGVMYAGEVKDTIAPIINTSDVDIAINDIAISPADGFSIIGPLQLPIVIPAGQSLQLKIQANPGYSTTNTAQLQVFSRSSSPNYHAGTLMASVIRPPLSVPDTQQVTYFCAVSSPIVASVSIVDTGAREVTVTGISAQGTKAGLVFDRSFPDTLQRGTSQTITVHFDPTAVAGDTLILQFMGGTQVMKADTLLLQRLTSIAATSVVATGIKDSVHASYDIRTAADMTPFDLRTIVVHLDVDDPNVATINRSSIALAPGLSNATISSIQPEANGYAITVTSTSSIASPSGSSLVTFDVDRYVSIQDSSLITAQIATPEKSGCLNWTVDTSSIAGAGVCGSSITRAVLSGHPLLMSAAIVNNPVESGEARIMVTTSSESDVHLELADDLGILRESSNIHCTPGQNAHFIDVSSIAAGAYTVRISSPNGSVVSLRLLKLH